MPWAGHTVADGPSEARSGELAGELVNDSRFRYFARVELKPPNLFLELDSIP